MGPDDFDFVESDWPADLSPEGRFSLHVPRETFADHLTYEVQRARRYRHYLTLVLVQAVDAGAVVPLPHKGGIGSTGSGSHRLVDLLRGLVRSTDLIVDLGETQAGVVLVETSKEDKGPIERRISEVLAARKCLRIGTATFPEDGRTSQELLASAGFRLASE